jgi:hypothetical protein
MESVLLVKDGVFQEEEITAILMAPASMKMHAFSNTSALIRQQWCLFA